MPDSKRENLKLSVFGSVYLSADGNRIAEGMYEKQ
jgi:hypothetical protein